MLKPGTVRYELADHGSGSSDSRPAILALRCCLGNHPRAGADQAALPSEPYQSACKLQVDSRPVRDWD